MKNTILFLMALPSYVLQILYYANNGRIRVHWLTYKEMVYRCENNPDPELVFYFLPILLFECLLGAHRSAALSTHNLGLLYWLERMCSSTNFGVTQITCWPFQYFTMFILCSVEIMSVCVILVIWLQQKPLKNNKSKLLHSYLTLAKFILQPIFFKDCEGLQINKITQTIIDD